MIHEGSSAMLWARIKIDWKKTEEKMKAVGFTDEEIKKTQRKHSRDVSDIWMRGGKFQ